MSGGDDSSRVAGRPRLLVLAGEDPARPRGGLGVAVARQCAQLEGLGIEVTVLHPGSEVAEEPRALPALDPYALPRPALRRSALAAFGSRALAAAEGVRPDAVVAHDWVALDAAAHVEARLGTRFVGVVHSTEWDRTLGRVDPSVARREGELLRRAQRVLAVSERTREQVVRRHHVPRERTAVLAPPLPLDPALEAAPGERTGPPRVAFLGRLVPQKGLDLFLRAAREIRHVLPRARFVVAGDGPGFADAVEAAVASGLGRCTRFTGHLSRAAVVELLDRSGAVLMPSLVEPFGLVAVEAAQRGVPVVASSACGFLDAVPAYETFDPLDAEAAAAGVVSALQEPARVRQWRERVRTPLERLASDAGPEALLEALLPGIDAAAQAPPHRPHARAVTPPRAGHTPPSPAP